MRVFVPANGTLAYPDISIVCGEEHTDAAVDTLLTPVVIFGILSPHSVGVSLPLSGVCERLAFAPAEGASADR